jgi:hypothetical protein
MMKTGESVGDRVTAGFCITSKYSYCFLLQFLSLYNADTKEDQPNPIKSN